MNAKIKYSIENTEKEIIINNFKSAYDSVSHIDVRVIDEFGIESTTRIPMENVVSINIER